MRIVGDGVTLATEQITLLNLPVAGGETAMGGASMTTREDLSEMSEYLKRPRCLGVYTASPSARFMGENFFQINVMQALLGIPAVDDKLKSFRYLQADLNLRIEVAGSPYLSGLMMASWTPTGGFSKFENSSTMMRNEHPTQRSVLPHCYISVNQAESCDLKLPFLHKEGKLEIGLFEPYDTFRMDYMTSVQWHSTNAPETFSLSVWAWFDNINLEVPVYQGPEVTGSTTMPTSGTMSVRGFARNFAHQALDGIMSAAGLGKPKVETPGMRSDPFFLVDATADRPVISHPLAGHFSLEQAMGAFDGKKDSMSFAEISGIEAPLFAVNWDPADLDHMIYSMPVSPVFGNPAPVVYLPPSGFVAYPFKYWMGPMKLKLQVVGPKLMSGTLRVTYRPNQLPSASRTWNPTSGETLTWVFNVSEGSVLECMIPFTSAVPLGVGEPRNSLADWRLNQCNGSVDIEWLTPLRNPQNRVLQVVILTSFPGLRVFNFDVEPTVPFSAGEVREDPYAYFQGAALDEFFSFRDLVKIQRLWVHSMEGENLDMSQRYVVMNIPLTLGRQQVNGIQISGTTWLTRMYNTPLSWVASAYLCRTGGLRFTVAQPVRMGMNTDNSLHSFALATLLDDATMGTDPTPAFGHTALVPALAAAGRPMLSVSKGPNASVTLDVPLESNLLFANSMAYNEEGDAYPHFLQVYFNRPSARTTSDSKGEWMIFQSAADDFNLSWLVTLPKITAVAVV